MKINRIDTYIMCALAFVPLIISSAVAVSTIGDKKNEQTTVTTDVTYNYKYQTNELSSSSDFVVGNYYFLDFKIISSVFNGLNADFYNTAINDGFITIRDFYLTGVDFLSIDYTSFQDLSLTSLVNLRGITSSVSSISTYAWFGNESFNGVTIRKPNDSTSTSFVSNFWSPAISGIMSTRSILSSFTYYLDFQGIFYVNALPNSSRVSKIDTFITNGFVKAIPNEYNIIESVDVDVEGVTENIEQVFVRNLTYFNHVPLVEGLYNWSVTNVMGGTSNQIFDIAFSYCAYIVFLFVVYLLMSVLLFFIKFAIKCLNAFFEKGNKGGV